jgi:hypothetical protein
MSSASSHSISRKSPSPRAPTLSSGFDSRAGEVTLMIPAEPLAHSTPRLTGWSGVPSMKRTAPSLRCTLIPQRQAHM